MLGIKGQGQINLQNSEHISFQTTNSKTTFSSPPLESNIPDIKLGLNRPLLVPLSQHIRLIWGLKLPLCVTRWCTGPAIDLWPEQSVFQYRTAYSGSVWRGKGNPNAVPFFSLFSFNLFPFLSASMTPILLWRVGCLHPQCTLCVSGSLSCKCTHYWEAKHNISYRHLSDCFSFAEQQHADGFSQLYSQLQNYVQFDEIASCFFGVLNRVPLKSVCRR